MKGEFFRNWSHLESPETIHIKTHSIMGDGIVAMVLYECNGIERELATGVVFVEEEIELTPNGERIRYPSKGPFGPENSDYVHSCTSWSAWQTWFESPLSKNHAHRQLGDSYPSYKAQEIARADVIKKFENGWAVFLLNENRIEEFDILPDGSIEVWRSRTPPGESGTQSSLERHYQWFDSPVKQEIIKEKLINWAEDPSLSSLEKLVFDIVKEAEIACKTAESLHNVDTQKTSNSEANK